MKEVRKSVYGICLATVVVIMVLYTKRSKKGIFLPKIDPCAIECTTGEPCQYPDELDFRIIVLTYNRPESLSKCLSHIAKLDTLGDNVGVDIWIDRSKDGKVDELTLNISQQFQLGWKLGQVCVHVQQRNAYIIGQWVDTWRPRKNSREIALILEDDIDISPLTYKWLKLMDSKFRDVSDVAGYTLQMENVNYVKGGLRPVSNIPNTDNVFVYRLFGTWGFSPKPNEWRDFQDWFHEQRKNQSFKPYMPGLKINGWFWRFEKHGRADSMWEMWPIYYHNQSDLFIVYSNLRHFTGKNNTLLDINRLEPGLHYKAKSKITEDRSHLLLSEWKPEYERFPEYLPRYDFDGSFVK